MDWRSLRKITPHNNLIPNPPGFYLIPKPLLLKEKGLLRVNIFLQYKKVLSGEINNS